LSGRSKTRRVRHGYPVAVLVGLDEQRAVIWIVHSETLKQHGSVNRPVESDRSDEGTRYNFYNAIVSALKPLFSSGTSSLVVAGAKSGTQLADEFITHIRRHHAYLTRSVHVTSVVGDAMTASTARALVKASTFQTNAAGVIDRESDDLIRVLDTALSDSTGNTTVLFSLDEIDRCFKSLSRHGEATEEYPQYVIMTDTFWSSRKNDPRLQRTMDVAKNTGVKTHVLRTDGKAGERIAQLGGLVCLARKRENRPS